VEYGVFRGVVLYFFAAVFHYTGLLIRAVEGQGRELRLDAVVLAGNGSRFLEWLQREWGASLSNPFREVLLDVLTRAAGRPQARPPRVVLSPSPKQEVALGLVSDSDQARKLTVSDTARGSVVGERVRIERAGAQPTVYGETSRIASHLTATTDTISGISWEEGPMEIDRFHEALIASARERLATQGGPWAAFPGRLRHALDDLGPAGIQQATRVRLEKLLRETRGVPGSLFMVEAAAVLDHLMDALFVCGGGES
jgi:hypothetical protein